ncbi:MAG: hypothetical protein Tp1123DCM257201_66 [Prokaryotic dsDNA virus sp.]|nr:MAG: hypothetical protein Tp1123DCM257201_66 [Prokaryotic dsDNA virus sp.]
MAGKWGKNVTQKLKQSDGTPKKAYSSKGDIKAAVKKSGKLGKRAQVAAKAKKDS